jgi:hypothetical protein
MNPYAKAERTVSTIERPGACGRLPSGRSGCRSPRAGAAGGPNGATRRDGGLQQLLELVDREAGVVHDAAHGEGVDGVGAGDGQHARAIRHNDMLALANHLEASSFEGADGPDMGNSRKARHGLDGNLDLPHLRALSEVGDHSQILADGIFDVGERFSLGVALRPASGKARCVDADPFVRAFENDFVSHGVQYTWGEGLPAMGACGCHTPAIPRRRRGRRRGERCATTPATRSRRWNAASALVLARSPEPWFSVEQTAGVCRPKPLNRSTCGLVLGDNYWSCPVFVDAS